MDHYTTKTKNIVEALNDVQKFLNKIAKAQERNANVIYDPKIKINFLSEQEKPFKWEVELKLYKHET